MGEWDGFTLKGIFGKAFKINCLGKDFLVPG
jgi:hypothetical protein